MCTNSHFLSATAYVLQVSHGSNVGFIHSILRAVTTRLCNEKTMDITCMFHALSSLCRCVNNEAKCKMQIYNRSKTCLSCDIIRINSTQAMRNDVFAIHHIHLTNKVIKKHVNASPLEYNISHYMRRI